jgi:hypothetical protein
MSYEYFSCVKAEKFLVKKYELKLARAGKESTASLSGHGDEFLYFRNGRK